MISKIVFLGLWLVLAIQKSLGSNLNFYPEDEVKIFMGDTTTIYFNITGNTNISKADLSIQIKDEHVTTVEKVEFEKDNTGNLTLNGVFLGVTNLFAQLEGDSSISELKVIVTRKQRPIDTAFAASVAILVSIIYINFGCALNIPKLKEIIRRPIGPAIGLIGQFLAMPLLSYALGYIFFPNRSDMRLGLLFVGVSPAGGASNIWTCILDGNIDLSVTMTTVSTFAAFGLMPLWLFTLGKHVFENANVEIPYSHIGSLAIALVVPLAIGFALQRWLPKVSGFLARILKGFSSLLILFIIIFATITNWYLFSLLTWEIAVAGLMLPFCGYLFGYVFARWITKRSIEDSIAICIETGIQNTGIAIFMLRFGLPQPQADLTTVVPVAVAIMTPFPLMITWVIKKIINRKKNILKLNDKSTLETSQSES